MEKAAKAEAKMKALCERMGITPEGRSWLDVCLDPFKDIEQHPVGYPDKQLARSCVQVVHDTLTVVNPGVDGNWDCNIFLDTLWKSQPLYQTDSEFGLRYAATQTSSGFNRGGLIVRAAAQGTPLTMVTTQNSNCKGYVTDVFDSETPCRLLATGFEVHDTTQELKKQGAVVVYRVSDDNSPNIFVCAENSSTQTVGASGAGTRLPEPPTTQGEAIDLPLSQEWLAKDGVYVVPVLNTTTNPPSQPSFLGTVSQDSTNPASFNVWFNKIIANGVTRTIHTDNLESPFCLSGAFFTGLDKDAVLVVNLCYYIEQFPAYNSPLHRLTKKGCPLDNEAIEFYTKIARVMPVGVPVNDNFLGSFIAGIANIARTVAPYVGTALRVGGALANVMGNMPSGTSRMAELSSGRDYRPASILSENTSSSSATRRITSGGLQSSQAIVRSTERDSIAPISNNNRAIVPYTPLLDMLAPKQRREVEKEVVREMRPAPQIRVRNKRSKEYNRTNELVKKATMPNAGNKWAGGS